MLTLTPDQVIENYAFSLWQKTAPTKIRAFTAKDLKDIGSSFIDLEKNVQRVALDRCLCVGVHDEWWTCSQASLERERYPITPPDQEGFRLYVMKQPQVIACFDIPVHFGLLLASKTWESAAQGGIITWNQRTDNQMSMRVIEREIFLKTYEQCP